MGRIETRWIVLSVLGLTLALLCPFFLKGHGSPYYATVHPLTEESLSIVSGKNDRGGDWGWILYKAKIIDVDKFTEFLNLNYISVPKNEFMEKWKKEISWAQKTMPNWNAFSKTSLVYQRMPPRKIFSREYEFFVFDEDAKEASYLFSGLK